MKAAGLIASFAALNVLLVGAVHSGDNIPFVVFAEDAADADLATYAFSANSVALGFGPSIDYGSGVFNVTSVDGTSSATLNSGNLNIVNVNLAPLAPFSPINPMVVPGSGTVAPDGTVSLSAGQTVRVTSSSNTVNLAVGAATSGSVYPNGSLSIAGTAGTLSSASFGVTFAATTQAAFYPGTDLAFFAQNQIVGTMSLSGYTLGNIDMTDGVYNMQGLTTMTNVANGASLGISAGYTGSITNNAFSSPLQLLATVPGGGSALPDGTPVSFPAATLTFPLGSGSSATYNLSNGGVSFALAASTFVTSSQGVSYVSSDSLSCTLTTNGAVVCTLPATTRVTWQLGGANVTFSNLSSPATLLTDGTTFQTGSGSIQSGGMVMNAGSSGWAISSTGVTSFYGSSVIVYTTDSITISLPNATTVYTSGTLNPLTGVLTITNGMTLTSTQNYQIIVVNGATALPQPVYLFAATKTGEVELQARQAKTISAVEVYSAAFAADGSLTIQDDEHMIASGQDLPPVYAVQSVEDVSSIQAGAPPIVVNAGAIMVLTGVDGGVVYVTLPEGVWSPSTGCTAVPADSSVAINNSNTGQQKGTIDTTAPTAVCSSGAVVNLETGQESHVTPSGNVVPGPPPPPVVIPENCRNDKLGLVIRLQEGGYANAMDVCEAHDQVGVNVTNSNIAAVSRLLETCGGLWKSVYVGSYNGVSGGCLALYSPPVVGLGTVSTATCYTNRPVMCAGAKLAA